MRFLFSPTPDVLQRARPPVRAFLAFAALLLVGTSAQRAAAGGLAPSEVEAGYLAEGTLRQALAAPLLWEELHTGAFVYGFLVLMLGSLLAVCPLSPRLRAALLTGVVATAALDLAAPFAVVALHGFGVLRVVSFAGATLSLFAAIVAVWASFGRPGRRAVAA